jgi:hypothetical protein
VKKKPPKPKVSLEVQASVQDVRIFLRTGIIPAGLIAAVAHACDRLGPLELHTLERDWQAYRLDEDQYDWHRRSDALEAVD